MKKSVVAIMAVAIIGLLGAASKHHDGASLGQLTPQPSSANNQTANTSQSSAASSGSSSPAASLKDGTYTGASEDTPYGTVQIAAVISGGKITDVKFLQMPGPEGHSKEVTYYSEPLLKQTTLQKQSSHIDFVSGATTTSEAYQLSLQAALDQAA